MLLLILSFGWFYDEIFVGVFLLMFFSLRVLIVTFFVPLCTTAQRLLNDKVNKLLNEKKRNEKNNGKRKANLFKETEKDDGDDEDEEDDDGGSKSNIHDETEWHSRCEENNAIRSIPFRH